jgi:hypothetical protein
MKKNVQTFFLQISQLATMAFIEKYLSRAQGYDKISLSSKLGCQQKKKSPML